MSGIVRSVGRVLGAANPIAGGIARGAGTLASGGNIGDALGAGAQGYIQGNQDRLAGAAMVPGVGGAVAQAGQALQSALGIGGSGGGFIDQFNDAAGTFHGAEQLARANEVRRAAIDQAMAEYNERAPARAAALAAISAPAQQRENLSSLYAGSSNPFARSSSSATTPSVPPSVAKAILPIGQPRPPQAPTLSGGIKDVRDFMAKIGESRTIPARPVAPAAIRTGSTPAERREQARQFYRANTIPDKAALIRGRN